MHKPAEQGLPVIRGDDLDFSFYVKTRDSSGVKQAIDLTGYTVEAKVFDESGATLHNMTGTLPDAVNGLVRLQLSRVITATLAKYGLYWSFALVTPSDVRRTYIVGRLHANDPGV